MKIGLVSSALPLVQGGARFIVEWLAQKLVAAGHEVETIWVPFVEEPEHIFSQMASYRLLDLDSSFDRVVTFRPPAHVVKHHAKVVWFIHHLRGFYDLWDSPYRSVPDTPYWRSFREALMCADTNALREARTIFTNSKVVSDRVRRFNGLDSEVLYPPVFGSERFHCDTYGDAVVCVCRMEHHKRQHLLIQAMRHVQTPVKLVLAGASMNPGYIEEMERDTVEHHIADRVTIDNRWISEDEKISLLSTALVSTYVPLDEDSYGYPTLEAAHASKATITLADAGGVSEFVRDGYNGFILPADPRAIAEAFDRLWVDRELARRLGEAAKGHVAELGITWENVIERLLA